MGEHLATAGLLALALAGCGAPSASPATAPTVALAAATSPAAAVTAVAPRTPTVAEFPAQGGEGGEEATVVYVDPAGRFSFDYPQSWGKATQPDEDIRVMGRDEFISVRVVSTALGPMDFGNGDASALAAASADYQDKPIRAYQSGGMVGAVREYSWRSGPSPVTGKMVPSSARRYYLPVSDGKLAVFTYSSPVRSFDPEGSDDFAAAFKWLR